MGRALFASLYGSKATQRSDYFSAGKGVVEVAKMIEEHMRGGHTFVCEFKIVSSSEKISGEKPNSPGSTVGWVQKLDGQNTKDVAASNIMGLFLELMNAEQIKDEKTGKLLIRHRESGEVISEEDFTNLGTQAVEGEQIFVGQRLNYETRIGHPKSNPQATHHYASFRYRKEDNSDEEVNKRRAEYGLKPIGG